jgi:hypothetical protein
MHLRPFNGHHCQVPVTDGKGKLSPKVKAWLPFAEELFRVWRVWRAGRKDGCELFVCPEMGPISGAYNIHGLPNSWEDACDSQWSDPQMLECFRHVSPSLS